MRKSPARRITDSFDKYAHDDIRQYIDWLRSSISEFSSNLTRTILIILLLVAAFELVTESPGTKLSLGSFQIYKGSMVLLFIPVIVAALYFQIIRDTNNVDMLRRAFDSAFAKWSCKGGKNDIAFFIRPSMPMYWLPGTGWEESGNRPSTRIIEQIVGFLIGLVILLGTIAFEIQAYLGLYRKLHNTHFVLWVICCGASALLLTAAFALMQADNSDTSRSRKENAN